MQFVIDVVDSELTEATTKTGKPYNFINLTYKQYDNFTKKVEVKSRKVMPFGDGGQGVIDALTGAEKGSKFQIEAVKNGEYWDWTAANIQDKGTEMASAPASKPATAVAGRSNYETPEERARRQVLIVRQSCIAQAVAAFSNVNLDEILETAGKMEAWVNRE